MTTTVPTPEAATADIPHRQLKMFALSGQQDPVRGWGRRDESFRCMGALRELGHDVWFHLGDLDLATHLWRTGLLRDGIGLAEVTRRLAGAMGVGVRVLPMTEQEVTTRIEPTGGRRLHHEEFLVREGAQPPVHGVTHEGLGRAEPGPGVLSAIATADLVVLGPSNPVASMWPVLGVPGVRAALLASAAPVVAVSPIVSGVPIDDPGERMRAASRAALLGAVGAPATAAGVAGLYADLCRRFVLDIADADECAAVSAAGVEPVLAHTLLHHGAPPDGLLVALFATASR